MSCTLSFSGTTEFKTENINNVARLVPVAKTGPIPSDHVHIYNLNNEQWRSSHEDLYFDTNLNKMKKARMNHGCIR